jgi:predicted nucleic acid-binding protein
MLCDSNVLIYAADPTNTCCLPFVEREDAAIASLSRIEVLGFHGINKLSDNQRNRMTDIVESLIELHLSTQVIQQAITLGQEKKMGLADAIIAATALVHSIPLATRNVDDFKHIAGLRIVNPFEAL